MFPEPAAPAYERVRGTGAERQADHGQRTAIFNRPITASSHGLAEAGYLLLVDGRDDEIPSFPTRFRLAHHIRETHHDLPVLLASGYSHVLAQNGTRQMVERWLARVHPRLKRLPAVAPSSPSIRRITAYPRAPSEMLARPAARGRW